MKLEDITKQIDKINYTDKDIQIYDSYVKYTLLIKAEFLMITIHFNNPTKCVFSIFRNKELMISDEIILTNLVNGINNYLKD